MGPRYREASRSSLTTTAQRSKVRRMQTEAAAANTFILTVYVDEDTKNDLVALAKQNERAVTAELRIAIRRHLRVYRKRQAA